MTSIFRRFKRKQKRIDIALAVCPTWDISQPPIGIAYLKAFLEQNGFNAKCFDFNIELFNHFKTDKWWNLNKPDAFMSEKQFNREIKPVLQPMVKKWAEQIVSQNPKFIGLSLYMSTVNASIMLAKEIKSRQPDILIIAGGPEVSRISDRLRSEGLFDFLVDGEGELAILKILQEKRSKHSICHEEFIHDLDTLPFPDYSDFNLQIYKRFYQLPLLTSRGCIGNCTFCADKPLWKTYRFRHAESVYNEIAYMGDKYSIKNFELIDSTLNGNLTELSKFCDILIEKKADIKWSGKAILRKEMTPQLLQKMKNAGCMSLAYGLESGSQKVLDNMRKNLKVEDAKRIIRDTYNAGIDICCFIIYGYPTETDKDFEQTLRFIRQNYKFIKEFGQITGCHIEYNSYLGKNLEKHGIEFKDDGWHSRYSTPEIRDNRRQKLKELLESLYKRKIEVQS